MGASARRSTFLNLDLSYRAAAALQYNIFPYSESSERELTVSYFLGATRFAFEEETIFEKTRQTLGDHGLVTSFDMEQPWGEAGSDLEFSNFLSDFGKLRIELDGELDYRLLRGLSLSLFGGVELVRDQIFLPRSGISDEEVLLERRALETDSRFFLGFGFSYTFGSIYNNIVNSRLRSNSGRFHRIF